MTLTLSSPAFAPGTTIPKQHSCEGADLSPALQWSEVPTGAQSLALIVDDPDAPVGTWVHWVLFNLPPNAKGLPEGVDKTEALPDGTRQGLNDFRKVGYGGPCPPPGKPHRYFFKLYALDATLNLAGGAKKADLERAMQGHVLAQAQVMGTYAR